MASANFINECKNPAYCNRYGKLAMLKPAMKSETGTSPIKVTDGVEYPLNELKINGKTTQDNIPTPTSPSELVSIGYENYFNIDAELYDGTITKYNNGFTLIKGTNRTLSMILSKPLTAGTYVLKADIITNTLSAINKLIFGFRTDSSSLLNVNINNEGLVSFTLTGTATRLYIYINNDQSDAATITVDNVIISDVAHNYVSYGKYGIEVRNAGKNLFDGQFEEGIYNGNTGAKVAISGYMRCVNFIPVKENTNYKFSTDSELFDKVLVYEYKDDYSYNLSPTNKQVILSNYLTTNSGTKYITFRPNGQFVDTSIKVQIEEGTTATSFENYRTNTKVYELNEPLRSVGNIKDLLYIKNDVLYVQRNVGNIILNGTEDWEKINNAFQIQSETPSDIETISSSLNAYSNYFNYHYYSSSITSSIQNGEFGWNSRKYLTMRNDSCSTVNEFKEWLSTHLTEIVYVLGEPVVEELGIVETPSLGNGINEISFSPSSSDAFEIQYGNGVVELNQSNAIQDFAIDDGCYDDGNIIGTVYCKKIKVNLIDALNYTLESESFLASVGLKYENNSTEYINLGKFTVEKPNDEMTTNYTSFVAYDDLLNNLDKKYGCNINFEENTITLADLYQDVCDNLGLIPVTTSFINDDIPISANPFTNNETNRFVLQTIAKIAASFVNIDIETNKIDLCWLSDSESPDYTFYKSDYSTVDGGKVVYGPVNSLVIKNSAIDSENVSKSDDASILNNGEHQLVISEDYILNTATLRQQAIEGIWERVHGLTYVDCELTTLYGKPFLKIGDKIRIYTDAEDYIDTYVLQHEFTYNGAYKSVIKAPAITAQEVTTKQDLSLGDKLRQTEVIVDKQNGTITQLVSKTNTIDTKVNNNYQEIVSKFNDYTPQSSFVNLENNVTQLQTDTYTKTEINTKLTDGSVTKVHTVSGTFDENGMTYEKTNAATKTTINEIGVNTKNANTDESILFAGYVDNNNTQFADYKGQTIVATENIIIKKYFVMPEAHSRIEKYGNGGGMFYV